MVSVTYGSNGDDFPGFDGQTVANVRAQLSSAYQIPSDAVAQLNGQNASESDILRNGDELTFVKQTAQKG